MDTNQEAAQDMDAEDVALAAQIDAESGSHADEPAEAHAEERARRKQQRRLDALTWTPQESAAVLHEELVLGHRTLQRTFNLWFVRTQIAMHKLQQELPNIGTTDQVKGSTEILEMQLKEIEKELGDELSRLTALAKNDGIDSFPPKSYSHPISLRVPVYAPGAARVLRLIRRLDDLFWALDYLFISGSINAQHKVNIINRWKRLMWGLVHGQTRVWTRARDALRKQGVLRAPRGVSIPDGAGEAAQPQETTGSDAAPTIGGKRAPAKRAAKTAAPRKRAAAATPAEAVAAGA